MYRAKDIMTDDVATCGADDTLSTAVQIMRERGCGCVPVVDQEGRVVGLVTDRDAVMSALHRRKSLDDIKVSEACSRDVVCCEAEDAIERAEVLMRVNRVRRLPVVGPNHVLVGVLSLTDLARHVELSQSEGWTGLSPRHVVLVLAATSGVTRPLLPEERRPRAEQAAHPIIERIFHG
jgi:CBS domain-containing protein